ncbi:MAG: FAD-dependent oxidoreductase [Pirellulales bacterium]
MSERPMRIVIVGGVAGGASAATRARRVNERAEVVLIEKDADVSFANCGLPYYIGNEIVDRKKLLVATADLLRRRFRIDVRTRHEVLRIDRQAKELTIRDLSQNSTYQLGYDKLILSPGASPLVPPLEGRDAPNVLTLRNLADTDRIRGAVDGHSAGRAVVIGAGFIGLEMVEQLARRGMSTALVELQPYVLPLLDPEMTVPVEDELRAQGVQLHLGRGVQRVEVGSDGRATAVELTDGQVLEGDLFILGIGVRPNTQLAVDAQLEIGRGGGITVNEFLQTSDADIYAVGDAVEYLYGPTGKPQRIALAGPANRAGRLAGQHAASGASQPMRAIYGTSIVRVFGKTAAMTGLTTALAARLQIPAASVTITANHHAGYFPGAEPLTLKLVFDPQHGKVLGAQAVGVEGVDKRIDVIATAMAFQATVFDLAQLDLAYAPPYGSAKDPVHMAAFAACNQLEGMEDFLPADSNLDGKQVVDVRTDAEIASRPLAGASAVIHIPVDVLRDRIGELDPARETVVTCATGMRAHIAVQILRQHGFPRVQNLAGGATVRNRAWSHHRSS